MRLRAGDILTIPFSLMWGGFAVFWEWSVIKAGVPFLFRLWGIPFVLVGLYMIVGRFFWDAYQRANTFYGVSDQRVLIITRGGGGKVKSLSLRTLSDATLTCSSSGSGSIQFGSTPAALSGVFECLELARSAGRSPVSNSSTTRKRSTTSSGKLN